MKLTFSFQTLILSVLAAALTVATAVWAVTVYESIYSIILRGFDKKLLAVSGGAAVFTDGDAHADYQREHRLAAFSPGPDGQLLGYDLTRRQLVLIDPEDGGALPYDADGLGSLPEVLRSLAYSREGGRLAALDGDGVVHWLHDANAAAVDDDGSADDDVDADQAADPTAAMDALLFMDGLLHARRGQQMSPLEPGNSGFVLAEPVLYLAWDSDDERLLGLALDASEVLQFERSGSVASRQPIELDGQNVAGLAVHGGVLYLAADGLLGFDLASGTLDEEPHAPGYFSPRHPFVERHAPAYREVRDRAGLTFLYSETHLGGDQIRYILDGSVGDDHTPPGYLDEVPADSLDEVLLATRGQAFVSDIRQWEAWGLIKISAEPIFASDGQVVALAGADVDIGVIRAKTRNALFAVLLLGVALLLLAGWVSLRVSHGLTRPLREIKDSALRIAAGYFDTRLRRESADEIGDLASSLNTLSSRLETQTRQSEAYQQTLIGGRMQLALQHALVASLDQAARDAPIVRKTDTDEFTITRAAAAGDAGHCLLWRLGGDAPPREHAMLQARIARMATHLLDQLPPIQALDALFQACPHLSAVALWDSAAQQLQLRCREPLALRLLDDAGVGRNLALADRDSLPLTPGQSLVWDTDLLLCCHAELESLSG